MQQKIIDWELAMGARMDAVRERRRRNYARQYAKVIESSGKRLSLHPVIGTMLLVSIGLWFLWGTYCIWRWL